MNGVIKPFYVEGQGIAYTREKYLRLLRRKAKIDPPFVGHPTKKSTKGRLRHFSDKHDVRRLRAKTKYENMLFSLGVRSGAF